MSQDVKPTRSEELRLKERIELAEDGHSILEQKRDGLIHEFMKVIDEARSTNEELSGLYREAMEELHRAEMYDGESKLKASAVGGDESPRVRIGSQNIMGVRVPEIGSIDVKKSLSKRSYGLEDSSARIDKTAEAFEELLEKVVEAAETQTKILRLLEEIEKTKRRVNALEHKTIPEMQENLDKVSQLLMEREREETFRMKKIKEMQEED